MIITTTGHVEGRKVSAYLGIVTGEAIMGVNIFRDLFAWIRDIVGGRASGYQKALAEARRTALDDLTAAAVELRADAVIGLDLDYEVLGHGMLMVSVNGTAVRLG